MGPFMATFAAVLALAFASDASAAGCARREGMHGRLTSCAAPAKRPTPRRYAGNRRVRVRGEGRVLAPVLVPPTVPQQPPLPRPEFQPRPVQPGQTPVPAYLPNNLPPVFAPQPLN